MCRTDFSKNTQISNVIKIRSVGDELLHADGQTDTTKLIVVFRNSRTRLPPPQKGRSAKIK